VCYEYTPVGAPRLHPARAGLRLVATFNFGVGAVFWPARGSPRKRSGERHGACSPQWAEGRRQ